MTTAKQCPVSLERGLNRMPYPMYRVWRAQMDRALKALNEAEDMLKEFQKHRSYYEDVQLPIAGGPLLYHGRPVSYTAWVLRHRWAKQWVEHGDFAACQRAYDPGLFGKGVAPIRRCGEAVCGHRHGH